MGSELRDLRSKRTKLRTGKHLKAENLTQNLIHMLTNIPLRLLRQPTIGSGTSSLQGSLLRCLTVWEEMAAESISSSPQ